jgi:hypothetical protein
MLELLMNFTNLHHNVGTTARNSLMIALATLLLAGCATRAIDVNPQAQFIARLNALCGQAFAGRLVSDPATDSDMAGKTLVMHVRRCSATRVEIPFHVGNDRSRTWVITQTISGLRLKHDHRHEDGSNDPVTLYGGDTATDDRGRGTASRQSFPVDAESIATFRANGLNRSVTNVWTIELDAARFAYELRRPPGPTERYFRVEFDLAKPVPAPPAPWGHE